MCAEHPGASRAVAGLRLSCTWGVTASVKRGRGPFRPVQHWRLGCLGGGLASSVKLLLPSRIRKIFTVAGVGET